MALTEIPESLPPIFSALVYRDPLAENKDRLLRTLKKNFEDKKISLICLKEKQKEIEDGIMT